MYCKHCGHELNSENVCTNPKCPSKFNTNENHSENFEEFHDINGITTSEMINFVGEKKSDYYLNRWVEFQNNENFLSWNWPAFLCGFYWFWYRKMYGIMFIILSVSMLGTMYLPDVASEILSFGIIIGCGLFANQLYMKHATKRIKLIKTLKDKGVSHDIISKRIKLNGGTTIVPIIASIVFYAFTILTLTVGLMSY